MKNNKKNASSVLYLIIFLTMFFIFLAFAVDGAIVLTNRARLQNAAEISALAAASEFNYSLTDPPSVIESKVEATARDTFRLLQYGGLESVNVNNTSFFDVEADAATREVNISINMVAQPYFLAFFGVNGINVAADVTARSEELDVIASYYDEINWLTVSARYHSDIITKAPNMNDTAILLPLGDFKSASYDTSSEFVNFNFIEASTTGTLSLGPGGFVTIKLPAPIVDKPGYDLYIEESGTIEGYMVFAGLDNNPEKPYVDHDQQGDGLSWINITCSGKSDVNDSSNRVGAYSFLTTNLGFQDRFFGSAYFDLGDECIGNISMAKYIRIIDDNDESGFVRNSGSYYYKTRLYGEASTATSGADIGSVSVLNHVKIVSSS